MSQGKPVEKFIAEIPPVSELRECLTRNVREGNLLRKLIRLAEQRDKGGQRRSTPEPIVQ